MSLPRFCLLLTLLVVGVFAANSHDEINPDYVPCEMWQLQCSVNNTALTEQFYPLRLVVIGHTVSTECHNFLDCTAALHTLQSYYLSQLGYDLPYNFMIGNDGRVYEARGWGSAGAHTAHYNNCSLGIGFIGDYRVEGMNSQVTELQVAHTLALLELGVRRGHLHPDYVLVGQKDLRATQSPGENLYAVINQWPHYNRERYSGMTCREIYAQD